MRRLHDLDVRTELRTERAGSHTLLDLTPTDGTAALAVAASLTATVADLHELGVVHGRLTPDHVVIREDGRPALCGFADAGRDSPEADVTALATLYEMLATAVPRRRSRRSDRAVNRLIAADSRSEVNGPVATIQTTSSGMSVTSSLKILMLGWPSNSRVICWANCSRSTARAEPAGTRACSAARMIKDPNRRISSFKMPGALRISEEPSELEQTSSASRPVL